MNKKVLFIDGQVFQSGAWDRGMGKYSLALLKQLAVKFDEHYERTYVLFTENMPLSDEVKKAVKQAAPTARRLVLDLETPPDPCQADIPAMQRTNENRLNALMAEHVTETESADFLILSLFIDQVCSVFPEQVRRILLFYDLIPFQYHERYSKLCTFPGYLARYRTLFQADIIWSISQTVADDLSLNLGLDQKKIFNIDGAAIERKSQLATKPALDLPENFILMPSGNDLRKNNARAVQGFEELLKHNPDINTKLVLTSYFDEGTKQQLTQYSQNIIFSGNVKESELLWLYEHSTALLFVPEYEGLGLPILEAIEAKKPIVCSNLGAFNEMSTQAFYYCSQYDPISIGEALQSAVDGRDRKQKLALYPEILKRYSWENSAAKAMASLSKNPSHSHARPKPRLAVLAPSPAGYSDIGKRILQLHPALAEHFAIDYYLEPGKTERDFSRPNYLPSVARVFSAADFNKHKYRQYDAVLYHVGNSEFHVETIKSGLYLPGFAVFHDTHLADIFKGELLTYGYISKERYEQEGKLDKLLKSQKTSYVTSLANAQRGIITHSGYARSAIEQILSEAVPLAQANLPVPVPRQVVKKLHPEKVSIGFAGIIHPAKGLDIIERVAASDKFYECKIRIFGLSLVPDEIIKRLETYPNVSVDTDVTDFEFQNLLKEVDVLMNFRRDYRGESSAATLEAMRFGVVPIVRKVGWYEELPDDCVLQAATPEEAINRLEDFIFLTPNERQAMASKAREYVAEHHNYQVYAQQLSDFIADASGQDTANNDIAEAVKKSYSLQKLLGLIQRTQ